VISDVELYEPHDLRRGFGKALILTVVAIPIQHDVRRQNAAARNGCDIRDVLKRAGISEETDNSQVIKRGAKSTAR
jgi:hypothetical protein